MEQETKEKIVESIWKDICGRSGGDHFLEGCDLDIQQEIRQSWLNIIEEKTMDKQITIPTPEDMMISEAYIREQKFRKLETKEAVTQLFLVLVGYGLEPQKAANNISSIVSAMANEYGD